MAMTRFWMVVAVVCIAGAGVALWLGHFDAAFVIGTIGALAWFLNYRVRAKAVVKEANEHDENFSSNNED
jgi:hypothetical protein